MRRDPISGSLAGKTLYGLSAAYVEAAPAGPNERLLFLLGGRRRARPVARRVLCAVPRAALRAPCAVPDVVLRAPCVVPDAAPYQTSASQWTAWRAWCWSGLQQVTPSELQARPQVQTQPRIQKEQERFDDRPASVPNVHPCQAPGLLPSCTSRKFQRAGIDLNQPGRWQQNPYRARRSRRWQWRSTARSSRTPEYSEKGITPLSSAKAADCGAALR